MKVFKWIYYPVLLILIVAFVALGFVGVTASDKSSGFDAATRAEVDNHIKAITDLRSHNANYDNNLKSVSDYIRSSVREDQIIQYRPTSYPDSEEGLNTASYSLTSENGKTVPRPSVVTQSAVILASTAEKMNTLEDGTYYVNRTVNNLVVAIPGADTLAKYADPENEQLSYGDVIMFTAHYDTSTLNAGAANNTAAVANMIEVINAAANRETKYKNDLLFVFTSGGEEGALGAYAFKYQFKGFDDIYSRVKLAFNFDAVGGTGALIMSEVTSDGAALVSAYADLGGKAYSSSLYSSVFAAENKITDFDIYDDIAAYDFVTLGNENSGTAFDTVDNLDSGVVNAFGNMMNNAVSYFGDKTLGDYAAGGSAGFFNYLGATIWYTDFVAYIIAAIIILLVAAIVFFAVRKKSVNFVKAGLGAAVQLLTMLATLVCLYVAYLIVTLLLTGLEVINIHAIATVVTANVGLLVSSIVLAFALSVIFYIVFKKVFAVRATDVVRGNALLIALLAVIFCFAAPQVSYLFFVVAVLQLVVMLVTALTKDKFKAKFGFDMERLFLYVIPVILMMPVLCGELYLASAVTPAVMLPLYLTMFTLYGGAIMPYADYLKRPLGKLAAALPMRTIRVERVVTEKIEDAAKKGKFTEVTHAKVFKEKVTRTYSNALGITLVSFLGVVAIVLFTAFGGGFGSGVSSNYSYYDEIYKDALVYVCDDDVETLEVYDLDAYKYIARYVDGFTWDADKGAYVRTDTAGGIGLTTKLSVTADSANNKLFTVNTSETGTSQITVTLSGFAAGSIDKVTFTLEGGKEVEYDLTSHSSEVLTFILPYAESSGFTFEIEGDTDSVDVSVEQRGSNIQLSNNYSVFSILSEAYSLDETIKDNLTMNIIMKTSSTFSF